MSSTPSTYVVQEEGESAAARAARCPGELSGIFRRAEEVHMVSPQVPPEQEPVMVRAQWLAHSTLTDVMVLYQ